MFHICAVGYYWAEDAETLEYWTECSGTFFDAVNMAEELKADMEKIGMEDITYKVYSNETIVAYC